MNFWVFIYVTQEIIQMIIQYLHDEGYQASKMIVHDEAIVKWYEREELHEEVQKAKKAILGYYYYIGNFYLYFLIIYLLTHFNYC